METQLISPDSPYAREHLADVKVMYTDLDGTMLAPGGRLLFNSAGKPSLALPETILRLAEVGVEVVIVTGRNRIQLAEIARLLSFKMIIGEMGSITQRGIGPAATIEYFTGDWDLTLESGRKPTQYIEESGVIDALFNAFPEMLEYHTPWCEGREVTHMLRGRVDVEEVQQVLDRFDLPLTIIDNGRINPLKHGLKLDNDIHAYHILPKGVSKGVAVKHDIEFRGIDPSQTVAIGDSRGDVEMGDYTGAFGVLANGLGAVSVMTALSERKVPTIATVEKTVDGWVEFANAIINAKNEKSSGAEF